MVSSFRFSTLIQISAAVWIGSFSAPSSALAQVTTVHAFGTPDGRADGTEGAYPLAGVVQATDGNFYGTTTLGGVQGISQIGDGTVFRVTPGGVFTLLHAFTWVDGVFPYGGVVQATDGSFYGTTNGGGFQGCGTVFKITASGIFTVLHHFDCTNGGSPLAGVVQATDGNFYGTTGGGGSTGYGTVFKMTPAGTVTVLHSFDPGLGEGAVPYAALIQAADGNFYGTTSGGGSTGNGTVFKMTPAGAVTVLHSFDLILGEGAAPIAALVQAADGNFYGTTSGDGWTSHGTVFTMTPTGAVTVLHSFQPAHVGNPIPDPGDGAVPTAALIQASDGNFYGTTGVGGSAGYGTIFRITSDGTFKVIYAFTGGVDGGAPFAALMQGTDGALYGTTPSGGATGSGTFFRLGMPSGTNVTVSLTDPVSGSSASLTFASLAGTGFTLLETSSSGAAPPFGFSLGDSPMYFNITTTATFTGPVIVCLSYDGINFTTEPRLFHSENGIWLEITTSLDTVNMVICGSTTSFSAFAILQPNYGAVIQPPISSDGTSVFKAHRGVVPVKFTLTFGGTATCQLPPATISVFYVSGSVDLPVNESDYFVPSDTGSNFKTTNCQYVYNLGTGSLGSGTYKVQINVNGAVVGSGTFALK